jgi:hypothetical protein
MLVVALAVTLTPVAFAEDAVGKWTGIVKAPDAEVPAIVTIAKGADGKLSANLESPSQAPGQQFPADKVESDGAKLTFEAAAIAGSYSGTWDAGQKAWVGKWTQGGVEMALDLSRAP